MDNTGWSDEEKNSSHDQENYANVSNPKQNGIESPSSRRRFLEKAGKAAIGIGMTHFLLFASKAYAGPDDSPCMSGLPPDDECSREANPDYCPGGNSPEDTCTGQTLPDYCPGGVGDECTHRPTDVCNEPEDDDEECPQGEGDNCKPGYPDDDPDICPNGVSDECGTGTPEEDECPGGSTKDDVCVFTQDKTTDYCQTDGANSTDTCDSGKKADDQCPAPHTSDLDVCVVKADANNDQCAPDVSGSDEK